MSAVHCFSVQASSKPTASEVNWLSLRREPEHPARWDEGALIWVRFPVTHKTADADGTTCWAERFADDMIGRLT